MAMVVGGLLALIHAFFSIHLRADQIVGGTAINFLALGVTGYLFTSIYHGAASRPTSRAIPNVELSFLQDIPDCRRFPRRRLRPAQPDDLARVRSSVLADVRRALQDPDRAAHPLGRRASARRRHRRASPSTPSATRRSIVSGMLAALGGAYLSIGFVGSFNENMTAGRGFIALAAADLRQLAAVRRVRGGAAVRLLERARDPAASAYSDVVGERSSRRCRTS